MTKRYRRKWCNDEPEDKRKSEDWCFICKDGGKLRICDREECIKAYHSGCLKEKKLSMPSSKLSWHCGRHTCSKCRDPSTFFCYCCPTALCHDCVDAIHFLLIKNQHGLCHECRGLALCFENEVEPKHLSKSKRLFREYYEIVKKNEGFSLKDLQSPEERSEIKHEVLFASIVPDNMMLVYLKKSLVQELLKEPESFESKLEGSYVRVESDRSVGHQTKSYQLMQVTGVKKTSSGQDTDIKLQLFGMPNDICINSLSDANFSEAECEDLRQKMKAGLLKKPTVDEFEEKARSLHKDITDHRLAREKRILQYKIDCANEKGRRSILFELLEERKVVESPSYRLQLLNMTPKVIQELLEPCNKSKDVSEIKFVCEDTDDQKKNNGSPRFISINDECDGRKIASGMDNILQFIDIEKKSPGENSKGKKKAETLEKEEEVNKEESALENKKRAPGAATNSPPKRQKASNAPPKRQKAANVVSSDPQNALEDEVEEKQLIRHPRKDSRTSETVPGRCPQLVPVEEPPSPHMDSRFFHQFDIPYIPSECLSTQHASAKLCPDWKLNKNSRIFDIDNAREFMTKGVTPRDKIFTSQVSSSELTKHYCSSFMQSFVLGSELVSRLEVLEEKLNSARAEYEKEVNSLRTQLTNSKVDIHRLTTSLEAQVGKKVKLQGEMDWKAEVERLLSRLAAYETEDGKLSRGLRARVEKEFMLSGRFKRMTMEFLNQSIKAGYITAVNQVREKLPDFSFPEDTIKRLYIGNSEADSAKTLFPWDEDFVFPEVSDLQEEAENLPEYDLVEGLTGNSPFKVPRLGNPAKPPKTLTGVSHAADPTESVEVCAETPKN